MARGGYAWKYIIIGGGLEGLSLAYHLSKSEKRILLLERGSIGGPQTPLHAMTYRVQYSARENVEFAIEARKALKKLAGEVRAGDAVRETGIAWLLDSREASRFRRWNQGLWRTLKVDVSIHDAGEAGKIEPSIARGEWGYIAVSSQGGVVDVRSLALALARRARKNGATIAEGNQVLSIEVSEGSLAGVRVEGAGTVPAENVIVAAGAWTVKLLQDSGLAIPLSVRRTCAVETEAYESILSRPLWVPSMQGILVHVPGAGLAAATWRGSVEKFAPRLSYYCISGAARLISRTVKGGWSLRIEWARPYLQPISPDRSPLIGRMDHWPEGLYVLSGFSGHGAGFRVYAGQVLAEYLVQGKMRREAQAYTPERFSKGRIINEALSD